MFCRLVEDALNFLKKEFLFDNTYWVKEKLIGRGNANVYLYTFNKTNFKIAVKKVKFEPDNARESEEVHVAVNEIKRFEHLKHERIVTYYGSFTDDAKCILYICLEYMDRGSLYKVISNNGALDIATTKKYTRCILEGLAYLHENEIFHGDIKCQNVLLDSSDNVKLADFGTARHLQSVRTKTLEKTVGTEGWMAPEMLKQEKHGLKSDIWSIGCTVVAMLTTKPPKMTNFIPNYELPAGCEEANLFLQKCFFDKANLRASAAELLNTNFCSQ